MVRPFSSQAGSSLVEVLLAIGVLTVGMVGAAGVLTQGMEKLVSSPGDVVATQKAAEAIEAVFSARDNHKLTWSQIRNRYGYSGSDGGVFYDGPLSLKVAGADGLVNTSDDGAIETSILPGPDQLLGTSDDTTVTLTGYTREIQVRDVANEPLNCGTVTVPCTLRSIKVIITFRSGSVNRTYTLTTYISNYA
jgi:hypothetical protein